MYIMQNKKNRKRTEIVLRLADNRNSLDSRRPVRIIGKEILERMNKLVNATYNTYWKSENLKQQLRERLDARIRYENT